MGTAEMVIALTEICTVACGSGIVYMTCEYTRLWIVSRQRARQQAPVAHYGLALMLGVIIVLINGIWLHSVPREIDPFASMQPENLFVAVPLYILLSMITWQMFLACWEYVYEVFAQRWR